MRAHRSPRASKDVATIYTTTDLGQARELLAKYEVGYIYIGALERSASITGAVRRLQHWISSPRSGEPVFQQGDITIYRVNT